MENKLQNKRIGLSGIQVSLLLVLVLLVEIAVVYYGYAVHKITIEENIYLIYGVAGVMIGIFVYFSSLFVEGKWMTFFRKLLLLSFSMVLLIMVVLLKLEIDKIQLPKDLATKHLNDAIAIHEDKLKKLEFENIALKEYINKQTNDLIVEIEINRRAIHAQQNSIKGNASQIESGKKYQILKNPF